MLRPHPQHPHFNIGRKGSVIYYAWHDISCVRSYTKPRNPRTQLQQANRGLHARMTRISGQTKVLRRFCFDGLSSYRSSHTAFIGLQMCQLKRAASRSDLPVESRLRWGRGPLPGASRISFTWKECSLLKWECDKRKLTRQSDPNNRVVWVVWNASRDVWQWSLKGGQRKDGGCALNLPEEWKGEELFVWLLFYDAQKGRFSCDSCLHVKEGTDQVSSPIENSSLYTQDGYCFEELVLLWNTYRGLRDRERRDFWEDHFT